MPYLETLFWKLAIMIIKKTYPKDPLWFEKVDCSCNDCITQNTITWIENHIKRINL